MVEKYSDQILGAVLAGGGAVLSAVLAWFWKRANEWWRSPQVNVEIGSGEGHIYENVLIKSFTNGSSTTSTGREAIFIRVRVINIEGKWRRPEKARGCIGYLASVERWNASTQSFMPTKYQDFLRLEWSFNKETLGMDLLPGIPVWLDVVYILPPKLAFPADLTADEMKTRTMHSLPMRMPTMESAVLKIASNPPVNRYAGGFELPGLYRIQVQVSGENFGAKSILFYCLVPPDSVKPEVLDEASWRERLAELQPASALANADYN